MLLKNNSNDHSNYNIKNYGYNGNTNSTRENNESTPLKPSFYHPPHLRSQISFGETYKCPPQTALRRNNQINRSCDDIKETSNNKYIVTKSNLSKESKIIDMNYSSQLNDIIKNRENLSELASRNIDIFAQTDKQKLQAKNENDQFILNQGLMEEKMRRIKMNLKVKENIQKEYLNKYVKQGKAEVSNYYKNYVENPNVQSGIHMLGMQSHEKTKIIYAQDLIEQSKARKEKELMKKVKEEKVEKKSILYQENRHNIGENEKQVKKQKMKEEFVSQNSSLLEEKKRKELSNRKKVISLERERLEKLEQTAQYELELISKYKNERKNKIQESLNKQISEKAKLRSQSQVVCN